MHAAYLAGLLDTEGSIMLVVQAAGKPRVPHLSIQLPHREPLDAIRAEFGGYCRTKQPKDPKATLQYEWRVSGNAALGVLGSIRPHLVIGRRQALADILLNEYPRKGRGAARRYKIERLYAKMRSHNKERVRMPHGWNTKSGRRPLLKPDAEDFAYLIGALDGQGWFAPFPRTSPGSVVEITTTDPELVGWCAARFGGTMHRIGQRQPGKRQAFTWRLGKREAETLLALVGPHLLIPAKREAALKWVP